MMIKVDFPDSVKRYFNEIQIDIQGVKIDDPSEFITIRYASTQTGMVSGYAKIPVTDIEKYRSVEAEKMVTIPPIADSEKREEVTGIPVIDEPAEEYQPDDFYED